MARLSALLRRMRSRSGRQEQQNPLGWPIVYLPQDVAEATARILASAGSTTCPHEGIAYWAGVPTTEAWKITTVLAPRADTTPGSYATDPRANAQVIGAIFDHRLQLLAQVHGHPRAWVGHSDGDDHGAFMPYTGFYSIVVPRYGRRGLLPLTTCGVHRYEEGRFVRLSTEQVQHRFLVPPTTVDLRRQA